MNGSINLPKAKVMPKQERYRWGKLTNKDKLAILLETKVVLGRGGKNWIKGTWFGKRVSIERKLATLLPRQRRSFKNKRDVKQHSFVTTTDHTKADCFCLEGAVEMAAFRLGYLTDLQRGAGAANAISIAGLIQRQDKCPIHRLNDRSKTEWKDIKARLDARIKEVKKEIKG